MQVPLHPSLASLSAGEYLALLEPRVPQREWIRLFHHGRIRSRGRPVGRVVPVGDLPELEVRSGLGDVERIALPPAGDDLGIRVLLEDERLIVLAKPAGVPVTPDRSGQGASCIAWALRRELARRAALPPERWTRPRVVHRLDRPTSGLLLFALRSDVERALGAAFEAGTVRKEYLALLRGELAAGRTIVCCPLGRGRAGRRRVVRRGGQPAESRFDALERFPGHTLAVVRPRTGRTHQVRVHARCLGCPVVGDRLYGTPDDPGACRPRGPGGRGRGAGSLPAPQGTDAEPLGFPEEAIALHAWRYGLPAEAPLAGRWTCPPPPALCRAVRGLRAAAGRSAGGAPGGLPL